MSPSPAYLSGCLTTDLPGTGGIERATPEDFYVEELPLYEPTGSGQHTLFEIEKRGLGTLDAIHRIAHALGVPTRLIGHAGLKDAQAVTRQRLSVEGVPPARVRAVQVPDVRILWAEAHRNRLKIGHLRGNRFAIRLREVAPEALPRAEAILAALSRLGVPNNYGPQRFGTRENTHLLGRCLLLNDPETFLRLYLGTPRPDDTEPVAAARALFDQGDAAGALAIWPPGAREERTLLASVTREGNAARAVRKLPTALSGLFLAGYQAYLFNLVLARRFPDLGRLQEGDLAIKHANGAFFLVTDAAAEQPRADALEISPSGPLFGPQVRLAEGAPGLLEREVLAGEGLTLEDLRPRDGAALEGDRRPLRVPLEKAEARWENGLVLRFTLPAGAYATNVTREVMKQAQKAAGNALGASGGF
ncbi:MAG: tRNA pseudouridine(13) synthase TruD [Anaerolineae bacterium]